MKHLIALLPYSDFVETFTSILKAICKTDIKVTTISKIKDFNFDKYPNIIENLYVDDDNMILKNEELLFMELDVIFKKNPFFGVLNYFEVYVELAAKITERYNLNGNTTYTAHATRNKYAMRTALSQGDVNIPIFEKVYSLHDFKKAINRIGFPCISKPIDGSASDGVFKITNESNIEDIYYKTVHNNSGTNLIQEEKGILVESYIEGPEISIEGIVSNKKLYIMGITAKTTEEEPYFNEIMHIHPAILSTEIEEKAKKLAHKTVELLDINNGGIHLEARIKNGELYIMECASRLGGDAIQTLITLSKGYEPYLLLTKGVMNEVLELKPKRNKYAGIRFVQTEKEGIVREALFDSAELNKITGIVNKRIISEPGKKVGRPPKYNSNRIGYIVAIGNSFEEVKNKLIKAESYLLYTIDEDSI